MARSASDEEAARKKKGRGGGRREGGKKERGEKQRVELMTAFYPLVVYIPPPFFRANPLAGIPPKAQRIGRQRDLSRITLKQCKQPGCR